MQTIDVDDDSSAPLTGPQKLFRVAAGLIVAASFGVWVYAYSGYADRDAPDIVAERALIEQAEPVCAAAVADVAALPNAIEAADEVERAAQIRVATSRFDTMVEELARFDFVDERDDRIFGAWLDDWRVILNDRRSYADRLELDPNEVFLITDTGVTERLDKRITRFANTNLITSCAAPTDV
jgi:hypothetical protein